MIKGPKKLGPFLGMNNRLAAHALNMPDGSGTYLADAVGVDIDDTGRLSRADGVTLVGSMTAGRSLFSDGARTLYADGTALKRITAFSPFAASAVDTVAANPISYVNINGEIYYTDGAKIARLDATNAAKPVGIPIPGDIALVATIGALQAAKYQVVITYFVGDEEGGASAAKSIDLTSGGVTVTLPATPTGVTHIGIYLSGLNGEVPFLHSVIVPAASITLSSEATKRACHTLHKGPMPAGDLIAHHDGRLLVADGSTLHYSDPYNFGMTTPSRNYLQFPADISVLVPCDAGIYVVADKTYWLTGIGTDGMAMPELLPYGAVARSSGRFPHDSRVFWLSEKGLVIGDGASQVKNVQEKDLDLALTGTGASLYVDRHNRVVATNG